MTQQTISFTDFAREVLHVEFSPAQQVFALVALDGVDPAALASDEQRDIACELFGPVEHVPDECRHVVAMLKGARVGGTWMWSLFLLYAALTADLSTLAAGEVAFAPIVAPDMKTARQGMRFALGAAKSAKSIRSRVVSENSDGFVVRRHDGREVSIECLAASRGGSSLRGRSMVAALMDESSFFRDAASGVINDSDIYRAIVVRVRPGPVGRLGVISTAWMEAGLLHEMVSDNHGNPKTCLACIAPTLTMRPDPQTRRLVEAERERDAENARREFDCETLPGGSGLHFDPNSITQAIDSSLPFAIRDPNVDGTGAGGDIGLTTDPSAGVIVHRTGDVYTVAEVTEMRPTKGSPLKLSSVVGEFAGLVKRHTKRPTMMVDHWAIEPAREHASEHGLALEAAPAGQAGKVEVYVTAANLLKEGKVRIPACHTELIRQLREITSKPTSGGGLQIRSPRRRGAHGDIASAFVLALHAAANCGRVDLSMFVPRGSATTHHNRGGGSFGSRWDGCPGRGF